MIYIEKIEVTGFAQNCRILGEPGTKKAVVVDPGGDIEKIVSALEKRTWNLEQIWLTHSHVDHCGGVQDLKDRTGAILYGHKGEAEMRSHVREICSYYGIEPGTMKNCPEPDKYIDGGDILQIGPYEFKALFTPGHSPGHLSFYNADNKIVLAGDVLFAGSIGRTDLPGGDHKTLLDSVRTQLFTLPGDTKVLSGHGEDTTIKIEQETNPFFS